MNLSNADQMRCLYRYREDGDFTARQNLILSLQHIAEVQAKKVVCRYSHIHFSELIGDAIEGIINTIEDIKLEDGIDFEKENTKKYSRIASYAYTAAYRQILRSDMLKSLFHEFYRNSHKVPECVHLDDEIPDTDNATIEGALCTPDFLDALVMQMDVENLKVHVTEKEWCVVRHFYGINTVPLSIREIQEELNIAQATVYVRKAKAFKKWKEVFDYYF